MTRRGAVTRVSLNESSSSPTTTNTTMTVSVVGDSSDDELDWEEVHVPVKQPEQLDIPLELELDPPAPRQNIEITLQARPRKDDTRCVHPILPFTRSFNFCLQEEGCR